MAQGFGGGGGVLRVLFKHSKGNCTPVYTHTDSGRVIMGRIKGNSETFIIIITC